MASAPASYASQHVNADGLDKVGSHLLDVMMQRCCGGGIDLLEGPKASLLAKCQNIHTKPGRSIRKRHQHVNRRHQVVPLVHYPLLSVAVIVSIVIFNSFVKTSLGMGLGLLPDRQQQQHLPSSNDYLRQPNEQANGGANNQVKKQPIQESTSETLDTLNISDVAKSIGKINKSLTIIANDRVGGGENRAKNDIKIRGMNRLLIRQLTNLVMNNEPEIIAENINGARISGQMVSESEADGFNSRMRTGVEGGIDHTSIDTSETLEGGSDTSDSSKGNNLKDLVRPSPLVSDNGDAVLSADNLQDLQQADLQQQQQQQQQQPTVTSTEEPYVTCPPDDEDQTMIEASSNLSAEQQQQLLAGVDSSGLLNNSTAAMQPPIDGEQQVPPQRHCVHAVSDGSRMIEVITKVITPILFSIIIVVGLLGNIIVMIVILEDRKTERELTPTGLLILDLSLADLSFIIFCIPFTGWDYSVGHWVFGSLWCKFNQYLIVVCALSSIYTLVLMSVDRFMAIVFPIECISYRTSKNTLYAIYIKWIIILIMASPTLPMHGLVDSPTGIPDQYACRFLTEQYNPLHFQIIFFITSYLFPLILIFCLYLSLLNKLWFGSKPHGHKESIKTLESKKKVTWLVAGIVVVFALCWCPIQVMLILMRLRTHKITATYIAIQVFSHILGYMNSCVNPIVYAFASETFHNSFKRSSLGRFCYSCLCINNNHHHNQQDYDRSTNFRSIQHNDTTIDNNNNTTTTTTPLKHTSSYHYQSQNHFQAHNNNNNSRHLGINDGRNVRTTTTTLLMTQPHNSNKENGSKIITLPLEPRDRDVSLATATAATAAVAVDNHMSLFNNNDNKDDNTRAPLSDKPPLIPRQATIGSSGTIGMLPQAANMPAKQQLVAHVVQSSNQVSHRCEPGSYQQG